MKEKLQPKNALKVGGLVLIAIYVKWLMNQYKVDLKEPPEDLKPKDKSQEEILETISQILEDGNSVVGCLFPHTSIADHIVFNRELQRWSEHPTAWMATIKFAEGKMGFAGLMAQAWINISSKLKMFYVTQAYLKEGMSKEEVAAAQKKNIEIVDKVIEFLAQGEATLYFYPEGTRVNKSEDTESKEKISKLSRAHPNAFKAAEAAASISKKIIYLAPMSLGDVPDGKLRAFFPAKTELTYGEPVDIVQLREEFDKIEGKIRFTAKAMKYHHTRNPAKKRLIKDGEKQFDDKEKKLYIDEPADFGFADYVMWTFAKLMPLEKRGIYGDDCVQIQ